VVPKLKHFETAGSRRAHVFEDHWYQKVPALKSSLDRFVTQLAARLASIF
jgi:hypothetical protein